MKKHDKWANAQMAAMIDIGIDAVDAQRSVNWVLLTMPKDADPATWIPTAVELATRLDAADVQDARIDWYAKDSVQPRFKRLLDARGEAN